jgi:hypothetical protein
VSERRAIICQECYEDKDLVGKFISRAFPGVTTRGSCDICGRVTICVRVSSEEAMQLGRRERMILKGMLHGLVVGVLVIIACLAFKHFVG